MNSPRLLLFLLWLASPLAIRAATINVEIRNFFFTPTNIVIQPGDTVVWKNMGFTPHDSTQNAPVGSRLWASPMLFPNESFSFTFTQPGVFPYMCALHVATFPQQTGTVSVVAANIAPTVSIASPANGAALTAPVTFSITANATDPDGAVTSVQFFVNGVSVGASGGPQFSVDVTSLAAGDYTLTAAATDDKGATTISAPVSISVQAPVRYALSLASAPANGGSIAPEPVMPAEGYLAGTTTVLTATPAEGFSFTGWSGDASGTVNPLSVLMDKTKSVTANFAPIVVPTFALTTSVDPTGTGTIEVTPAPNAAGGTYVQGTVVTLTASAPIGFAFTNWSGDISTNANPVTLTMDGPKAVIAHFLEVVVPSFSFTTSVDPTNGGSVQLSTLPNSEGGRYLQGTVVTLTATPANNFAFSNWSGAASGSNASIAVTVNSDTSVIAHFVSTIPPLRRLTVSINPEGGGAVRVTPANSSNTYPSGTLLALAAEAAEGFRFVRWSGGVISTNNPIPLLLDSDKSLTAIFEPEPTVDFAEDRGSYSGLIEDKSGTNYAQSGFMTLRVSASGHYRGNAIIGGMRSPVAGQFDRFGYAPLVARGASLTGSLRIGGKTIRGLLIDPALGAESAIFLHAANALTNAIPGGDYNFVVPAHSPVPEPGAIHITIRANGTAVIRGKLGDGALVRQRGFVSEDGLVALFNPLYHGRGSIQGWLQVGDESTGALSWFRPADSRSVDYPVGFALRLPVGATPQ